ncbi:MAG: DNA mismatch repair endonuclease MutL [Acidobacteriota bacterium]
MSKIRVLPDSLANKIAAGEVVERPASVVKELLENALDAGATKINIEIETGGKRLIRIIDDGEGMTRDDAIIAFERHATSKLRTAEDLESIVTLGFRGEALPSIAAVSKLFLRTKTANELEGTEVEFNGGKLINVRDIAWHRGTEIEVKELFFNMPARRKFLKSDATESFHITNLVQHYALSNPQIGFLLVNNGRDAIRVSSTPNFKDRAYQILGSSLLTKLLEVNQERDGLKITGYVSNPQEQRSSRDAQYLFINHRFVKDQLVGRALTEAYRSMMPSGTYPAAVLFIEVPPTEVDVNVHPAKTEVRFLHESIIFAFVRDAIAQAIKATEPTTRFPNTFSIPRSEERLKTDAPRWQTPVQTWEQKILSTPTENAPFSNNLPKERVEVAVDVQSEKIRSSEGDNFQALPDVVNHFESGKLPEEADSFDSAKNFSDKLRIASTVEESPDFSIQKPIKAPQADEDQVSVNLVIDETLYRPPQIDTQPVVESEVTVSDSEPIVETAAQNMGHGIKPMGQIRDSYIIATDDEGLLLFDQHVVHERILFEQIRDNKLSRLGDVQPFLIPETLDLTPSEAEAFQVVQEELEQAGIETMQLSGRTIAIKTAPAGINAKDVVALVQQLLTAVERERRSFTIETVRDEIAASLACKAAIKVNMPLTTEKMEWLIDELMKTQNPMTCPHGRPIFMRFSLRDIERGFKRPV